MTMTYKALFTGPAHKDAKIARKNGFKDKIDEMIETVERNPFEPTPGHRFERLKGNLQDQYSRRITGFHRFIYEVYPNSEELKDEKTGKLYDGIVVPL